MLFLNLTNYENRKLTVIAEQIAALEELPSGYTVSTKIYLSGGNIICVSEDIDEIKRDLNLAD